MTIWMDLTNSLVVWDKGLVGVVRAELMLAQKMFEINPEIKFSVCTSFGFKEVEPSSISWLLNSSNLSESYSKYQKQRRGLSRLSEKIEKIQFKAQRYINRKIYKKSKLLHPYAEDDVIFSCGWLGSKKEDNFSQLKRDIPSITLIYTIFDLVLVKNEFRHFFAPFDLVFENYLKWIAYNCDGILYGGNTAKKDSEEFYRSKGWPILPSRVIAFGSDISVGKVAGNIDTVLEKYGIHKPYIFAVGTFDWKKNYKVLYRAYCILANENFEKIPDLVICGHEMSTKDLISQIKTNPITKNKIKISSFSDEELEALYQHCEFAVLPTLYEGSSVVLPEILDHGKVCLCSNAEPLKELGGDLPYYLDPNHPKEWSEAIKKFSSNTDELRNYENRVKQAWKPMTWKECSKDVCKKIKDLAEEISENSVLPISERSLFVDVSLLFYSGGLSGIPRAQLLLARYIGRENPQARFFTISSGKYIELSRNYLRNVLGDVPLDVAVNSDRENLPETIWQRFEPYPFKEGDVVFTAGSGFPNSIYKQLKELHSERHFKFVQLIYDFTPIIVPQTHREETVAYYENFLSFTYEISDFVVYGGKVAQQDGESYQRAHNLKVIPSSAIKFGSDIRSAAEGIRVADVLSKYGIKGDYLLTVGTLEARKNHEILYEAYLELMSQYDQSCLPQLVICGHQGWKTNDFQYLLKNDRRIAGKVIWISPSDDELTVLYQNCKFTLLASLYEGWSLTLPESLNYGKFCLVSNVAPLKEVAGDLVDYADPYDPVDWATKIKYYLNSPEELYLRELAIQSDWKNTTWSDCGKNLNEILRGLNKK